LQSSSSNPDGHQTLQDQTIKLAGYGYMLGDAALIAAALARGRASGKHVKIMDEVVGSALWFGGGLAAGVYGNPSTAKQLDMQAERLKQHLKDSGITIPTDQAGQNKLLRDKNFWEKFENFLYEHPSEMLNGAFGIGSALLVKQGLTEIKAGKTLLPKAMNLNAFRGMSSTFWMGTIVGLGALAGLFIKEDPEAQKKAEGGNFFDKALAFAKEKPLRITGTLYATNNIFTSLKAFGDFKDFGKAKIALKPHYFSMTTAACYIMSNIMLLMSNRDQLSKSGFKPEDLAQLEDAAARIIAAQPQEMQAAVLKDVSEYMAKQKGTNLDAVTLAKDIATRVGAVTQGRLQGTAAEMQWSAREDRRKAESATLPSQPALA
jgi:hypothetical protein